jgi:hypothetical protein
MNLDNFEKHVLFDKFQQFSEVLSDEKSSEKIDLEKLSFFKSVFDYIEQRIKLTLPDLVQESEMDALAKEIETGVTQINSFLGNENVGHITNATNNFNTALTRIKNFPIPLSKNDYNFSKKIANFESTVKKKYDSLEKEKENLQKEILDFKTDLKNKDAEIKRLFKLLTDKEAQIESLYTSFQTKYNSIEAQHKQTFENDKKTFRNEIDTAKTTFRTEIDSLKESIDTDTSDLVSKLDAKLEEAKKIVNVIGNVGVTGNYQIIANEHKESANFWRWVAIGFMAILSGLLIWTLFDLSSSTFVWTKSLLRIIAAAALSYPATYAAKESSKHRKLENLNRTAELELASVDAFIEMLDEKKKQEIKEKLVEKYFGNDKSNVLGNDKDNEELSISGFEKIINAISKFGK